jgi:plasmid stabilization system protein ParE
VNYRFYRNADCQQDEIWSYTCKTWGEAQAEKYISGLHVYIQQLADREIVWRPLPLQFIVPVDLDIEVYFGHYQKHYIFFKEIHEGSIGIMAIFHESMDIPVRLGLDLNSMQ